MIHAWDNPLKLRQIHHVEFWVGNAKQAAFFYRHAFGFSQVAYSGLETGRRTDASYALEQGRARFVLTTPLTPDHPAGGPHPRCTATASATSCSRSTMRIAAFEEAVRRGAEPAIEPHDVSDEHGTVRRAAIHTYGDTLHSFLSLGDYNGPFLPGYVARQAPATDAGILRIDHIVGNVELGKMDDWADWYSRVLGFKRYISFDDKDISTEYSALMSIVMSDDSFAIKFPINEPAAGKRKSQIDEYLDFYGGPGVQHIALQTIDIERTVTSLREHGVEFLHVPDELLRAAAGARRRDRRGARHDPQARHPRRSRRGGLPAAAVHAAGGGPADGVLRDHPAEGQPRVRQGQLPGAVRSHRTRAGAQRQPVVARAAGAGCRKRSDAGRTSPQPAACSP